VKHLFSVWAEIAERVRAADQILLLTDFDGTLSPIVGRPGQAELPDDTRRALQTLVSRGQMGVAIISGRSLGDIKSKVGIQGITYAGNHGIEIEGPWIRFVYPPAEAVRPVMRRLYSTLSRVMADFEGALVEDKGLTLSVHYRLVREERVDELKRACEETVQAPRAEGKIRTTEGKKVYEIRPGVLWDKEDAIVLILSGWVPSNRKDSYLLFFLGDDLTDEEGFRVMNAHGGISVFVGESSSQPEARYFLRSPDEVREFLEQLSLAAGPTSRKRDR